MNRRVLQFSEKIPESTKFPEPLNQNSCTTHNPACDSQNSKALTWGRVEKFTLEETKRLSNELSLGVGTEASMFSLSLAPSKKSAEGVLAHFR